MAVTRLRAKTQILKWYRWREDLLLLVLSIGGTPQRVRQFYRENQIDDLGSILEREVKTEAEARRIWGCPPFSAPSRWERLLDDGIV